MDRFRRSGFTIVELLVASSMACVFLLTIAMLMFSIRRFAENVGEFGAKSMEQQFTTLDSTHGVMSKKKFAKDINTYADKCNNFSSRMRRYFKSIAVFHTNDIPLKWRNFSCAEGLFVMISFRDDLKTAQLAFLSKYDDLAVKEMNEGNRQYSNSYIFNSYAVLVSKVRHKVYLRTVYRNRLSPGKKEFTSENWSGLRTECAENEISRIYLFIR